MQRILSGVLAAFLLGSCGGKASTEATQPSGDGSIPPTPSISDLHPIVVAYPVGGVALGSGYDMVSGRWITGRCVVGKPESLQGKELSAEYTDLQDRQQLFDSLKISTSGGVDFEIAGGSGAYDFSRSVQIDKDRRNTLAVLSVINGGTHLQPLEGKAGLELHPDAVKWAGSADLVRFRQECGDGFVSAIRTGGKLTVVFSYALDFRELDETLKISTEGRYGPAKGKMSMDRIEKDVTVKTSLKMSVRGEGAHTRTLPVTHADVLAEIKKIGEFAPEQAGAMEVVVTPYSAFATAPDSVRQRVLPGPDARGLAAQYVRLSDLYSQYSRAALNPEEYYHPFIAPNDLKVVAGTLKHAALCVSNLLNECAINPKANGRCEVESLLELSRDKPFCQALRKPDDQKLNFDALASSFIQGLPKGPATQGVVSADATMKLMEKKSSSSPVAAAQANEARAWGPYGVYLNFLAKAPLKRSVVGNTPNPEDEFGIAITLCKLRKQPCADIDMLLLSFQRWEKEVDANDLKLVPAEEKRAKNRELAKAAITEYLRRIKLGGLASTSCSLSLNHPLCLNPGEIAEFLPEEFTFGESRGFTYDFSALIKAIRVDVRARVNPYCRLSPLC